jgi:hypothetical protein
VRAALWGLLALGLAAQEPPLDEDPAVDWRERVLTSSGGIDASQYARLAAAYHTRPVLEWRLGPGAAKFKTTGDDVPLVHQPKPDGVWAINAGKWARVNPGPDGDPGAGWMMSGQLLFSPDPNAPAEYRAGCANARSSDGCVSFTDNGLCLRLRAEWTPDWWNRNSISVPQSPVIDLLRRLYPDLTYPPVATSRGRGGGSVTGFLVFTNGVVAVAGTGNDGYTSEGFAYPHLRLPRGKIPTAMTVTQNNEFVLVTTWDVARRKGELAVIAVLGRQNAQEKRYYWGLAGGWPTVKGLKLLGSVELPFAAPMAVDATVDFTQGNTRGNGDNANDDLAEAGVRKAWLENHLPGAKFNPWKQTARFGYAIVSSRAESKVAVVNLRPLLEHFRAMYLTTAERYAQTTREDWPHTFEKTPAQKPKVVATWTVAQPTTVAVGAGRGAFIPPRSAQKDPLCSLRIAYVATMSGTVRLYDVGALFEEVPTRPLPSGPTGSFKAGRNPTQIFRGYHSTAPDDLFVVSRGDRTITHANWDGTIRGVLRDRRLKDPVSCFVSLDQAGFGGAGKGKAVHASVLTVLDFNGRVVHTYAVEAGRGDAEQLDIVDEKGRKANFMHGFSNPLPGSPFLFTAEEVI